MNITPAPIIVHNDHATCTALKTININTSARS